MLLADPALAPTATCNVMWSIARQARAVRDPSAPETGEQHPCKHGYATERAAQLLTVCQLALLHVEGDRIQPFGNILRE